MVYVNLDPGAAAPLPEQAGDLEAEITARAPDVAKLTLARRLTDDIASNWKNVVDTFPECIRYIDEVLQAEDIALVESVQRGMRTPAYRRELERSPL